MSFLKKNISIIKSAIQQLHTAYCSRKLWGLPTAFWKTAHCPLPTAVCRLLTALCLLLYCQLSTAQVYPVQVNTQLIPPYSLKLSDYATTQTDKLILNVLMTDVNEFNRQLRFRFSIKGNGLKIQSNDFIIGANPVFVDGGVPLRLTNIDLRPYFELQNLQGITPQQYNSPLPDGMYQFCFEVFDWVSGRRLSNPNLGCFNAYLIINDPPFLNLPRKGDLVEAKNPQNILFNWTPRHLNANNVQYEFELREIWDTQIDPQAAFLASPNLYSTTTRNNTLLYGPGETTLLENKTYAWRVRALVSDGISETSVFRNNGYSEIFYFTYTADCESPGYILARSLSSDSEEITWQPNLDHKEYKVQYRKKGVRGAVWFDVNAINPNAKIYNLEPGTTYEFRVGGQCMLPIANQEPRYSYSGIQEFTTPIKAEDSYYNCGIAPEINITNKEPLPSLAANEVFTAGDFPVTIKQVEGQNGVFSGVGFIVVPYLSDTKIAVEFSNIKINTSYQLYQGTLYTTYDANWSNVDDISNELEAIGEIPQAIGEIINEIVGLFKTNSQIDKIYQDGIITPEEQKILSESILPEYEKTIKELENAPTKSTDEQKLLDAIKESKETIEETTSDSTNKDIDIGNTNLAETHKNVKNLTKITIYFNDQTASYATIKDAAIPTMSGVPIKIKYEKLGINDYGGLDWFINKGEKFLGIYSGDEFLGYYSKDVLSKLKEEQPGEIIIKTEKNWNALTNTKFNEYSIASVGDPVFTVAKLYKEGSNRPVDCICEYTWTVTQQLEKIEGNIEKVIPPINADKTNCKGSVCDIEIVAGGLGTNIYEAMTDTFPKMANEEKLKELKTYLDSLTQDKTCALYQPDGVLASTKSIVDYRTYFVEHNISTKRKFEEEFPYVVSSRDIAVIFSKVDLYKNLNENNYNDNSTDYLRGDRYIYSFSDLTTRYKYLFEYNGNSSLTAIIAATEQEGKAQAISTHDGYEQYVAKFGTNSAVFFWMQNYFLEVADPATLSYTYKATSKLFTATTKSKGAVKGFMEALKKLFKSDAAQKLVDELPQTLKPLAKTLESSNFIKLAKTTDGNLGIYAIQAGIDDVVEIGKFEGDKLVVNTNVLTNSSNEVIVKVADDITVTDASGNKLSNVTFTVNNSGEVKVIVKSINNLSAFLDDAFVKSMRAEVISDGLPIQFPNLSIDELTAIKVYTSDQSRNGEKIYKTLNTQLREGNIDEFNVGLVHLLDDGIAKLPDNTSNKVYRGVSGKEAEVAKTWSIGDVIEFKDFKSTSLSEEEALKFMHKNNGDVFYEILNPKGKNICPVSCSIEELEILFRKEVKFDVVDVKDDYNFLDPNDPLTVLASGRKVILRLK